MGEWVGCDLQTELAWAAGFFDGEGSVYVRLTKRHKGGTTGKYYPITTVDIQVSQSDKRPLIRFLKVIDIGRIVGPYQPTNPKAKLYWRWQTSGRPSVHKTLSLMWPYLSEPKKEQARRCWATLLKKKTNKSPKLPELPKG